MKWTARRKEAHKKYVGVRTNGCVAEGHGEPGWCERMFKIGRITGAKAARTMGSCCLLVRMIEPKPNRGSKGVQSDRIPAPAPVCRENRDHWRAGKSAGSRSKERKAANERQEGDPSKTGRGKNRKTREKDKTISEARQIKA